MGRSLTTAMANKGEQRRLFVHDVPFDVDQLCHKLRRIPLSKAVASPFASRDSYRRFAETITLQLFQALTHWWAQDAPFIPPVWKNSWLVGLPKPNKSTDKPAHLRPLALQMCHHAGQVLWTGRVSCLELYSTMGPCPTQRRWRCLGSCCCAL